MTDIDTTTQASDGAVLEAMEQAEQLVERLLGSFTGAVELLTVELGRRLGLYAHLDAAGPLTPGELARAAAIPERYAREWLEQQGAAGFLDVRGGGDERRYALPAGYVPVLLDEESPAHLMGAAPLLLGTARAVPAVAAAIRAGRGVPFGDFGSELREGIASLNRPGFVHAVHDWVRTMPDVAARLETPTAVVLDAGSGEGWSSIGLARAFPAARVVGVDLDAASVERARRHAAGAGVADRVTFVVANAADAGAVRAATGGPVALVTAFQALHDMGRPAQALAVFRDLLEPGGAVLVGDEAGAEEYAAPAGAHDRIQYAMSILHCLPATWAEDPTAPNGTVLRPGTVRRWADEAGFGAVEPLPIEHPFWRFFRIG